MLKAIHEGRGGQPVKSICREASYFPEGGRASELLEHFHSHPREYIVAIVDEYGDFAGIAALEDLIEVFMGEVRDEYESGADPQALPGGGYRLPGSFPVREWAGLMGAGAEPPADSEPPEYTTVAGMVIHHLGRMPRKGASVTVGGIEFCVAGMQGRRITEVEVRASGGEAGDDVAR